MVQQKDQSLFWKVPEVVYELYRSSRQADSPGNRCE